MSKECKYTKEINVYYNDYFEAASNLTRLYLQREASKEEITKSLESFKELVKKAITENDKYGIDFKKEFCDAVASEILEVYDFQIRGHVGCTNLHAVFDAVYNKVDSHTEMLNFLKDDVLGGDMPPKMKGLWDAHGNDEMMAALNEKFEKDVSEWLSRAEPLPVYLKSLKESQNEDIDLDLNAYDKLISKSLEQNQQLQKKMLP